MHDVSIILNENELVTRITLDKLREPGSDQLEYYNNNDMLSALSQLGYNHWQNKAEPKVEDYNSMVEITIQLYGEIAGFALLVGNYMGQVFNGGHDQYWGNGYASSHSRGAAIYNADDMGTHIMMMELMEKLDLITFTRELRELYRIMEEFIESVYPFDPSEEHCPECGGDGTIQRLEYNDETEEEEQVVVDCEDCDGTGEGPNVQGWQAGEGIVEARDLDTELYKIQESVVAALNQWFRSQIKKKLWKRSPR